MSSTNELRPERLSVEHAEAPAGDRNPAAEEQVGGAEQTEPKFVWVNSQELTSTADATGARDGLKEV